MGRLASFCIVAAVLSAFLIQVAIIVGNHGPVLPGRCFFGAGGFSLRPDRAQTDDATYPRCAPAAVRGFVDPAFQPVADALSTSLRLGFDLGAAVTVYKDGNPVVDVVAGHLDQQRTQLFERDTLAVVFSCSKVIESLVAAMLVDRGLLDYAAPVCKYWPEFCAGNPENNADGRRDAVTIADLMRHRGGLAAPDRKFSFAELGDADLAAKGLAQQSMSWHPSSRRQSYHAVSRGFYVRELLRRVDPERRSFRKFVAEEISGPLGVELFFGAPPTERPRLAALHEWPLGFKLFNLLPQVFLPRSISRWLYGSGRLANLEDRDVNFVRAALFRPQSIAARSLHYLDGAPKTISGIAADTRFHEFAAPSANAVTSAAALAKIGAVLAAGGSAFDVTLLSKEGLAQAMAQDGEVFDECLFRNITYTAAGWGADRFGKGIIGWAGAGGSMAVWLPDHGVSLSYVPNLMSTRLSKARGEALLAGLARSLANNVDN